MKLIRKVILTSIIGLTSFLTMQAQGPGGGRPPGAGPEVMIEREKQAVYNKIDDLSEDQKLLIDGIYSEFLTTLKETFQASRESGDREERREKMVALRNEKDLLIKDVLNADQFILYQEVTSRQKRRKAERSEEKPTRQ